MNNFDYPAIGYRIKMLRKSKGLNQSELAQLLGKSLRTVQKYETGEIEISIAVVNQIAELLESSSTYILGYESNTKEIKSLADIMDFLFKLETVAGLDFAVKTEKPPRSKKWECSISFDGKSASDFNADMCLFLEQWQEERDSIRSFSSSLESYNKWKEKTLAYYAASTVTLEEPEELDPETRSKLRTEYLEKMYSIHESK